MERLERPVAQGVRVSLDSVLAAQRYPASRQDIIDSARRLGAATSLLALLWGLPDRYFQGRDDVLGYLGRHRVLT